MIGHLLYLYLPLILANVVHMYIVKHDLVPRIRLPLSKQLFGENKTYRGFAVLCLFTPLFVYLINLASHRLDEPKSLLLGLLLGFSYALFELPNSYLKRKLKIAPGCNSETQPFLFLVLDKSDSAFGVSLTYCIFFGLGIDHFMVLFLIAFLVHIFLSILLVKIRVKETI